VKRYALVGGLAAQQNDETVGRSLGASEPMKNRPLSFGLLAEAVVIVASILLAFGIEAAWVGRQEAERRSELIESMRVDFESTRDRIAVTLALGDSLMMRSGAFMSAVRSGAQLTPDSLGYLLAGANRALHFEPLLTTYQGAVATGELKLIETPDLLMALADFQERLEIFKSLDAIFVQIFFLGSGWEMRRRVGGQWALEARTDPSVPFHLSEREYLEFVRDPEVYAGVESVFMVHRNMVVSLRMMDDAAVRALDGLERLR
jgi:hypothetical protein